MNIIIVLSAAIFLSIVIGVGLAVTMVGASRMVTENNALIEAEQKNYNERVTLGHRVPVQADSKKQIEEAIEIAARRAAYTPRGANMRIRGNGFQGKQRTAQDGVKDDPITAVKIAEFHTWQGAATGPVAGVPAGAPVPGQVVQAQPGGKIKLTPGKDYPVTEITAGMSGEERRKARIANAKAKSAAYKAAKAAGVTGTVAAPVAAPQAGAAPAAAPAAVPVTNIPEPELIEITDDMAPDEIRKARIANSKAKSAYNKALKAAGIDPKTMRSGGAPAPAVAAAPAAQAAAAPAGNGGNATVAAGIPKPELIELTDDMSPDEKRQARIANSKAKSAYNKALKAAGIDPKSVK